MGPVSYDRYFHGLFVGLVYFKNTFMDGLFDQFIGTDTFSSQKEIFHMIFQG